MLLAAGMLAIEIYKGVKGAHEFLTDFNKHVLKNATLRGILEISPEDIKKLEEQLLVIERLQGAQAKEHAWRVRQRDAIQARLAQTTNAYQRGEYENDLVILNQRIAAIERDGRALNLKESTLHNLDAILKQADLVGDETARQLRKKGHVSQQELEQLGINILALSGKLEEEHKQTADLLATMSRELDGAKQPAKAAGA